MLCSSGFSPLESFDHHPPNKLGPCTPARKRTTPASKIQRHNNLQGDPRCSELSKPWCAEARGRHKNDNDYQERVSYPCNLPPQLQNLEIKAKGRPRGSCPPVPRPCSRSIEPCPGITAPCLDKEYFDAQLKQQVFGLLQKPLPATTCASVPAPTPHVGALGCDKTSVACPAQPICTPTLPKTNIRSPPPKPESEPPRSYQRARGRRDVPSTSATQPMGGREGSPRVPEVVSRTPTDASALLGLADKPSVSLPVPPGLTKPSGRGGPHRRGRRNERGRVATRPVDGERRHNSTPAVNDAIRFEHENGPVATNRVISPPPSRATHSAVKLPFSKDVPRSPSPSSSSSSKDLSGGSSTLFSSETTYTSVDTTVSSKASQYCRIPDICRSWLHGYPCHRTPCRFLHQKPKQWDNPAPQPTPSDAIPLQPPGLSKAPIRTRDQKNELIPGRYGPPKPAEPPPPAPRPEPLYATTISDHIKVRFDKGFEVQDVVTGFESRWVHLGNIAGTVTSSKLHELLAPYNVESVNLPETSSKSVTAKVQFATAADAITAVTELNGTQFAKRTISARVAINNSIRGSTVIMDTDVQLLWQCPSRNGFAGYNTLKEARAAVNSIHGFQFESAIVFAEIYDGLPCIGAYNVMFKYLPANITEQGLCKFAKSKAVMFERPNYQSLDKAVKFIRSRLEEYGTLIEFDILPPPYKNGMVKAWARFTSPVEARNAQEDFDRRRPTAIGLTFISCRHIVSLSHTLSAASYKKMREDLGWLRVSWQQRYGPTVSIREKVKENAEEDTPAFIRLSCDQPKLLSTLKYEFEQLLHGETITTEKKPVWDDFLISPAGHAFIAGVETQYPGVQIQLQKNRRAVSLWGPMPLRHRAKQDIMRKVMERKALEYWSIPLSGKLVSVFCSAELMTLQSLLGSGSCRLDLEKRALIIQGNEPAFQVACKAVQDAQSRQDLAPSSDVICPVCFGEVVVPVSLACGHKWCRGCMTDYLTSAVDNKTFPLRCLGDDATCMQRIPLGLARQLLSAPDFASVIEAAFWAYIHARPDEFFNCPTPDCPQVYRGAPQNAVLQCPSCLVRICPACRIAYHDEMTCEERDVAEDQLFQAWTDSHDVKSCPGCKAPIERSEGCNHMTCTRCQTHSCWECLATFPKGQGIYEHMRVQHGGIGL